MKSCHLFLLFALGGAIAFAAEPRRPNLIVIMSDDMGYSDFGSYGGEIVTPHHETLAKGEPLFVRSPIACTTGPLPRANPILS